MRLLVPLLSLACVTVTSEHQENVDLTGVHRTVVAVAGGDVAYSGLGVDTDGVVDLVSWGRGGRRWAATRNEEGNTWSVEVVDGELWVTADSAFVRAGVDVAVRGPVEMDVSLSSVSGQVRAEGARGSHVLEGEAVETVAVEGELAAGAGRAGADLEIYPYTDGVIDVVSLGPVTLRLPEFGPYDLRVTANSGDVLDVTDLGFDELVLGDGEVSAWRFPGTTRIRVSCAGGFTLALAP